MRKVNKLHTYFFLFFTFFFFSTDTYAYKECFLQKNEVITVGCSYNCTKAMKWGIKRAAKLLGYKVKIINLYNENQSLDLNSVDAVLIPGGADINPDYYTENLPQELKDYIEENRHLVKFSKEGERRDPFEDSLLKEYFSNDDYRLTPILGICRGMQMLSVSQGIPLYLDIKAELGIKNRKYKLDKVFITDNQSNLYDFIKKLSFRGVEIHHQAVRLDYFLENQANWPNVNITALSHAGRIVEGIELTDRPVMGVQFHPEYTLGKVRRGVFKWLLNRACQKKNNDH